MCIVRGYPFRSRFTHVGSSGLKFSFCLLSPMPVDRRAFSPWRSSAHLVQTMLIDELHALDDDWKPCSLCSAEPTIRITTHSRRSSSPWRLCKPCLLQTLWEETNDIVAVKINGTYFLVLDAPLWIWLCPDRDPPLYVLSHWMHREALARMDASDASSDLSDLPPSLDVIQQPLLVD